MLWDATMKSTTNADTSASLPVVMKKRQLQLAFCFTYIKMASHNYQPLLALHVFLAISNKLSDNLYSLLNVIAQLKSNILRKEVY